MINSVKKKVLIVEDEESLRSILSDALVQKGVEVLQAKDGQDGIIKATEELPDLILLDILMPRMDGRAVLKLLRSNENTKNTPVIFLTNLNELDTVSELVVGELVDYIVKSDWGIEEVVKKVLLKLGL